MTNRFFDQDFLLTTPTAKSLFQTLQILPVIDCHSGFSAKEIAEPAPMDNITCFCLKNDKEKLQAMRICGVDEYYITGEAGDYEVFQKWAETVPYLPKNRLYHRTHLELQRYFGIYEPLSPVTALQIWNRANQLMSHGGFTPGELLRKFHVETVCTKEDPADALFWHQKIADEGLTTTKVLPTFCPDAALHAESPDFAGWLTALEESCSQEIDSYWVFLSCLTERLLFFKSMGGRTSFHTIKLPPKIEATAQQAEAVFQKARQQQSLTPAEISAYQAHLLSFLAKKYQDYGFSMEICVGNQSAAAAVLTLLEQVQKEHKLPSTIISAAAVSDVIFLAKQLEASTLAGRVHFSNSADLCYQRQNLRALLNAAAAYGSLPAFVGFVPPYGCDCNYPAFEYFRRVLADFLGELAESDEYPNYMDLLKKFAKDIAYENKKQYFGL